MLPTHLTDDLPEASSTPNGYSTTATKAFNAFAPPGGLNDTLSTIMRFHRLERLPLLQEALFSLAIQSWRDHETVIMLQNGTEEMKRAIVEMVDRQPWSSLARHKIISVDIAEGVDGRSTLLNRGIEQATGRYLAFLDDDDLIYHHGYATLIQQLKTGGCPVALGGCRMAKAQYLSGHWYIRTKDNPFAWGRTRMDLLRDNFVPIHSYVIDRSRIKPADLYFDDELPPLEDYDFLLRLCAKYDFDFSKLDTPVCEYRIHGLNSLPYEANAPVESHASHTRAQELIAKRKKIILCSLPVSELVGLECQLIDFRNKTTVLQEQIGVLQQQLLRVDEEQGRFLNTVTRKVYNFFGRFPYLERQISRSTHSGWAAYRKMKQYWHGSSK